MNTGWVGGGGGGKCSNKTRSLSVITYINCFINCLPSHHLSFSIAGICELFAILSQFNAN